MPRSRSVSEISEPFKIGDRRCRMCGLEADPDSYVRDVRVRCAVRAKALLHSDKLGLYRVTSLPRPIAKGSLPQG
jgi:hypothetical protein